VVVEGKLRVKKHQQKRKITFSYLKKEKVMIKKIINESKIMLMFL